VKNLPLLNAVFKDGYKEQLAKREEEGQERVHDISA